MSGPIETLRTDVVYRGPVFDVAEAHIRLANGTLTRHVTVCHPGAVVIVPRLADGRLLLIEQYRHALRQTLLEFPAGTREAGEIPHKRQDKL
jgi:ADP-ribose pyrophosphatase